MTYIRRLVPLNLEIEKKKFFFDPKYNPQFTYEQPFSYAELVHYGLPISATYDQAKRIMDSVIGRWKSESAFLEEVEGRTLERQEVTERIQEYLRKNKLENKVILKFSPSFIARTSVDNYTLNIRLPIDYRDLSFEGVLNHEVGTHIYRRINDDQQIWSKEREKYKLIPNMETEEGLAVLHTHLDSKIPYLWLQSVRYFATYKAQTMSFSSLFEELKEYIDDRERRWNTCLRAKRGTQDTSLPGGYTKDIGYLQGALKVGDWLLGNDFNLPKLYIGKIALEDLTKAWTLNPTYTPTVPPFYTESVELYKEKVKRILKLNKLV